MPSPSPQNNKRNPLLAMSAGCIAGGIEATAVWPMEYIKVRQQARRSKQAKISRRGECLCPHPSCIIIIVILFRPNYNYKPKPRARNCRIPA